MTVKWTRKKPFAPGAYWYRANQDTRKCLIEVYYNERTRSLSYDGTWGMSLPLDRLVEASGGQFAGPLAEPVDAKELSELPPVDTFKGILADEEPKP